MTPSEFAKKWLPEGSSTDTTCNLLKDLSDLTNVYCTLAERGARADAYVLAADLIEKDAGQGVFTNRQDLVAALKKKAKLALEGKL